MYYCPILFFKNLTLYLSNPISFHAQKAVDNCKSKKVQDYKKSLIILIFFHVVLLKFHFFENCGELITKMFDLII